MALGEEVFIDVVMRDTSAISWSAGQGYSLAVVSDPDGLFQGASSLSFIDPYSATNPAGLAWFLGAIRAPAAPGVYTATLRMEESGLGLFGETATITLEGIDPPNAAPDWAAYE